MIDRGRPWRVGTHYSIHVYTDDDVPVATFHTSVDAHAAVEAHNAALVAGDATVKERDAAVAAHSNMVAEANMNETTRKLVAALREAGASLTLITKAEAAQFDDYLSDSAMPINDLLIAARAEGLTGIADRAINGDFDATMEENTTGPWRVGRSWDIHVYEGQRPVATFFQAADAHAAVEAHNAMLTGVGQPRPAMTDRRRRWWDLIRAWEEDPASVEDETGDLADRCIRLADEEGAWIRVEPDLIIERRAALAAVERVKAPADTTVYVGIDWTESHRLPGIEHAYLPFVAKAPLTEAPYLSRDDVQAMCVAAGMEIPRLYKANFPHGNCGGGCVRAGQAQFELLLRVNPDRYAYWEANEADLRAYLEADVSILRDRTHGASTPLTLRRFRERIEVQPSLFDEHDFGGCGCFVADEVTQ